MSGVRLQDNGGEKDSPPHLACRLTTCYTSGTRKKRSKGRIVPASLRCCGPELASCTLRTAAPTAWFFCGVGHGYAFPILLGLVNRRARVAERGAAMAIYTTIDDGAVLVAGPVLGFLIETVGYAPMFRSVAGLLAGTTVLCLLWDRGREEAPA